MEAEFKINQSITVTGRIRDGVIIPLGGNARMRATRFHAEVSPGRGFGGSSNLLIDRYLTFSGPELRDDDTPMAVTRRTQYWLSEENVPVWVREIADSIETTSCPLIYPISPRILTEPK